MGRFAYIPLDFEKNLAMGLEREMLIKRSTDDLYVLDDFKVPVSATITLKEGIKDIEKGLDEAYRQIRELNQRFFQYINQSKELSEKLEEYIRRGYNDLFKRIEYLRQYTLNLDKYYREIEAYFNHNKIQIDDTFKNYEVAVKKILDTSNTRYNEANNLYGDYVSWNADYLAKLDKINKDIKVMQTEIAKKIEKLVPGHGSWNSEYNTKQVIKVRCHGYVYWMSNNPYTIYTGDSWWIPKPPPVSDFMGMERPIWSRMYITPDGTGLTPQRFSEILKPYGWSNYIVYSEWNGGVLHGEFISETPLRNTYARRNDIIYEMDWEVGSVEYSSLQL